MFYKKLLLLISSLYVGGTASSLPLSSRQGEATRGIIIRNLAKPRFFGAAANTNFLFKDENYTKIISKQYSIFTPENEMKWESIEPQPNAFNFTAADEIVRFAESVNAMVRGHTIEWENQLPPWVNSSLTADELDSALKNHIKNVLDHYRGKLYAFDIVNEMISDNDNETYKDNIWSSAFGDDAIPRALKYAREVDSKLNLYINDYGTEGVNIKSNKLYAVVQSLLANNVPLNGIGFQCHFTLGQVPDTLVTNLQRFADLGLDVAITELDINMRGPSNETALQQQARDYWSVVNACTKVDRCVSLTTWGVSDDHSWIPTGHVLPFDEQKNPKPAFFAIADAFEGKSVFAHINSYLRYTFSILRQKFMVFGVSWNSCLLNKPIQNYGATGRDTARFQGANFFSLFAYEIIAHI
ncbi:glycosyl hydrolase family 10 [Pyrrhoderma noxium]|uniref:Beta-xylanase n=1 Tax=Pyrrhoderma noxium TaxID=2282107 RepID=A0A286U7H5_9AGAM|nr:glycosyl hydrolase family 10 [Pyrrhoderma noxium]